MITLPTTNTLHRITLADKILIGPDFDRIREMILRQVHIDINEMPDGNLWETKRGLWPKRFANWAYKEWSYRVDPKLLSDVGGVLGKMTLNKTFYVDFVTEAKWRPGSFGEKPSSCWWSTSYGTSRLGLFEKGGLAMRFFSSPRQRSINKGQKGIGRAWILPTGNDLFLFNSYGYEISVSARVLASVLGDDWKYDRITFYIDDAYINHETAYRFSRSSFDSREVIRLPSVASNYIGYCYHCGDTVHKYHAKTYLEPKTEFVRIYHETGCMDHDLKQCDYCRDHSPHENMTWLAHYNEWLCKECMTSRYIKCDDCGRAMKSRDTSEVLWKRYHSLRVCNDCLPKYPSCVCASHFKNGTTLKKHQRSCRTYQRIVNGVPPVTLDQLLERLIADGVSDDYIQMLDDYGTTHNMERSDVHERVQEHRRQRRNPTSPVTLEELQSAYRDDWVSPYEWRRIVSRYAEQEGISYAEAITLSQERSASNPVPRPTAPEPPLYTWRDVPHQMEGMAASSQGAEAQRFPEAVELAGQERLSSFTPATLDGGQHVEPASQGEAGNAYGRATVDRLYHLLSPSHWFAEAYGEWQQRPERLLEPLVGIDSRLSEQEISRIREALSRNQDDEAG